MKRALLALLLIPALSQAGTITIRSDENVPAQAEPAKVVSTLIVGRQAVMTYYNEVTEQVCTYSESQPPAAPALTCVPLYTLSGDAKEKVLARAAALNP